MSSMRCPQCGFINWTTAEACKRCRLPINGAEVAEETEANSWDDTSNTYQGEPAYQWGDHGGFQEPSYAYAGRSDVAQKSGLAVASLVMGIVSMLACGLLGLGSITGLVLGIVALKKAKNSPMIYGGQGLAIAGIVLSVFSFFYIGVVFAVAIPNLIAAYRAANEGAAIASVKRLANAESIYQSGAGKYGTLQELSRAGLIDPILASGVKNHYVFEIKATDLSYEAIATPVKDDDFKGRSFYYSSKEQFIRAAKKGGVAATAYDPPMNENSPPVYRQTSDRESQPPSYQPAYQN